MDAAAVAAAAPKVSLKLLVDKEGQKVLFAEAGKDFVDFLFNTLSLPLATVIRLLTKQEMVGSVANVYQSIENLNENYIQPNQQRDILLKPMSPISNPANQLPLLPLADHVADVASAKKRLYRCGQNCGWNVTDDTRAVCPNCRRAMTSAVTFVDPPAEAINQVVVGGGGEGGFVKGVVTYMVMDDLTVMPMSTISSITLLSKFHVKDIGSLEERVVDVGLDEGVKLLKESLQSKTVLTNVFLERKTAKIPANSSP